MNTCTTGRLNRGFFRILVAAFFLQVVVIGGVAQAWGADDISWQNLTTESNVLSATCKGGRERDKSGKLIRRCPLR
ncbi:MAG: hypothetical protein D3923_07410 [Candidatus Electrothrix sp. AR3]|nr:hypothetical protein [Candidatus Electrothrix sp. AR3]